MRPAGTTPLPCRASWGLIHSMWCGCRPLPPLRRADFVLAKPAKTARSHIRPYAALRVPSFRCLPGAPRPTTCCASLHLASSATPKGAAHLPLTDTSTRPAEVAVCGVCTCAHEEQKPDQEQKHPVLSRPPRHITVGAALAARRRKVHQRFAGKPAPTGLPASRSDSVRPGSGTVPAGLIAGKTGSHNLVAAMLSQSEKVGHRTAGRGQQPRHIEWISPPHQQPHVLHTTVVSARHGKRCFSGTAFAIR